MKHFGFVACLLIALWQATPASARDAFYIKNATHEFKIEFFRGQDQKRRPAVVVLSGSRGFASSVYDEIGNAFLSAGIDVYLAHLLSPKDLRTIAAAKNASGRIAYYNERRREWISGLHLLTSHLRSLGYDGRLAVVGVSLGAETAALAATQGLDVNAVVLVDGVPRPTQELRLENLPPVHLIWGSADTVFPLSSAKRFQKLIEDANGTATMTVFEGARHDFFLQDRSNQAVAAYRDAIRFIAATLAKE